MTFFASLVTGLLLWACYPPVAFSPLIWWALIPLLAVLWPRREEAADHGATHLSHSPPRWWHPTRAAGAFLHGYLAGATFFLLNLKWLHHVTAIGAIMLALYLALYPGLWAVFAATIGRPRHAGPGWELARAVLVTAAAWTGLEWLRGIVMTGFGWNGLGVALGTYAEGTISQWAEWIGVTGLSFFIVAQSAFVVGLLRRKLPSTGMGTTRQLVQLLLKAFVGVVALQLGLGFAGAQRAKAITRAMENAPPLTVALVQPNIPQESKNLADTFDSTAITLARLTQQAFDTEPKPDLVVWPESSLPAPYYYEGVQDVLRQGNQLGTFTHILGIDDQEIDAYFNSIAIFRGNPLQAALHRKVHLVPFGEYLPARGIFGRFDFIREQLPGDFKAGDLTEPLPLPLGPAAPPVAAIGGAPGNHAAATAPDTPHSVSVIPLVCFEDTLGRVARRFARPEAQIIVNVTNDAWFQDSEGADQHLANAVFRAIELRRPMIRAANTGVTAVIDPLGHITHRLPRLQEGQLKATIPLPTIKGQALYARVGDLFSKVMLTVAGCAVLAATWARRRPADLPNP